MIATSSSRRLPYRSAAQIATLAPPYLGSLALFGRESVSIRNYLFYDSTAWQERLNQLGLTPLDVAILQSVADCRLITASQLQRLHFPRYTSIHTATRTCRKVLRRLTKQRLLQRRKRRIGGMRKGSAPYFYSVGRIGTKLLSTPAKTLRPYTTDPSDYFFEHTIGLTELYTQLHELAIAKKIQLLEVQTEPNCWRQYNTNNGKLRPDMFVRFIQADEEYSYFIELDRGTTHLPALLRKMQQYQRYYASGVEQQRHGVFPQVIWLVPDRKRELALRNAIGDLQSHPDGLFVVKRNQDAFEYFCIPNN